MNTKIKIISFLLLISFSGFSQESNEILNGYLKIAAENNPGLKARYAEFETAMQRVAQVNSFADPTLSFGYFISPVETRVGPQRAKIGLSQMFPWFGTLAAKGEMAALSAQATYQQFLHSKNELYFKVSAAWYPLYEVKRIILLQKENKEILTLDGHTREVTSVAFSPDGKYVLTASEDGRAILWLTTPWKTDPPKEKLTQAALGPVAIGGE